MKKRLIFCVAAISAFMACDKISENGNLDGQWQVMEIRYQTETGGYDSVVDKKSEQIYWMFQLDLMGIRAKVPGQFELSDNYRSRFSHVGNRLNVFDIYYHEWNVKDSLVTDEASTIFYPYGIRGNKVSFEVEQLTHDKMRLRSDYAILSFRKF